MTNIQNLKAECNQLRERVYEAIASSNHSEDAKSVLRGYNLNMLVQVEISDSVRELITHKMVLEVLLKVAEEKRSQFTNRE